MKGKDEFKENLPKALEQCINISQENESWMEEPIIFLVLLSFHSKIKKQNCSRRMCIVLPKERRNEKNKILTWSPSLAIIIPKLF